MINSELHFELADPYLEEENILWQPRCSRDSSVDSWSLWPSGEAWSLGRALFNNLAQSLGKGAQGLSPGGDSTDQIFHFRVQSSTLVSSQLYNLRQAG